MFQPKDCPPQMCLYQRSQFSRLDRWHVLLLLVEPHSHQVLFTRDFPQAATEADGLQCVGSEFSKHAGTNYLSVVVISLILLTCPFPQRMNQLLNNLIRIWWSLTFCCNMAVFTSLAVVVISCSSWLAFQGCGRCGGFWPQLWNLRWEVSRADYHNEPNVEPVFFTLALMNCQFFQSALFAFLLV